MLGDSQSLPAEFRNQKLFIDVFFFIIIKYLSHQSLEAIFMMIALAILYYLFSLSYVSNLSRQRSHKNMVMIVSYDHIIQSIY